MAKLELVDVCVAAGTVALVENASLAIEPGELVVLLGPNGAGKTSLLRLALGLLSADSGAVTLDGVSVSSVAAMKRAQLMAYLPQTQPLAWPNRVRDIVALGRFAYGAVMGRLHSADSTIVDGSLADCDLQTLADRRADTLSGGELARVHCARAFAARTPLLLADEPTAALDPLHQHQILKLLRGYVDDGGGALVVLHDIALAARYADRLIWMKDARVVANGSPRETLTVDRMRDVYGVDAVIDSRGEHLRVSVDGPTQSDLSGPNSI